MHRYVLHSVFVLFFLLVGCTSSLEVTPTLGVLELALSDDITTTTDTVELLIRRTNGEEERRSLVLGDELFIALAPEASPVDIELTFHQGDKVYWLGELTQVAPVPAGEVRQESMVVDPAGELGINLESVVALNPNGSSEEPLEIIQIRAIPHSPPPDTPKSYTFAIENGERQSSSILPAGQYRFEVSATLGAESVELRSPPVVLSQGTTNVYEGADLCHPFLAGLPCRQDNNDAPTLESTLAWGQDGIYLARIAQTASNEESILFSHKKQSDQFIGDETSLGSGLWWGFHSLSMAVAQNSVFLGYTENTGAVKVIQINEGEEPLYLTPDTNAFTDPDTDASCNGIISPYHQAQVALSGDGNLHLIWQGKITEYEWLDENDHLGAICTVRYNPTTESWDEGRVIETSGMNPRLHSNGESLWASWEILSEPSASIVRSISVLALTGDGLAKRITKIQKACADRTNIPYGLAFDNLKGIGFIFVDCNNESEPSELHMQYFSPQGTVLNTWSQEFPASTNPTIPSSLALRWTGFTFEGAMVIQDENGATQIRLIDLLDANGLRNPPEGEPTIDTEDRTTLVATRSIAALPNATQLTYRKNPNEPAGAGTIALSYVVVENDASVNGALYINISSEETD